MALLIGFALVVLLGIAHHYGLMAVRRIQPDPDDRPQATIMIAFIGLLALHTAEILAFAVAYRGLLAWGGLGALGGAYDQTWAGLVYFSGINFATLGYTQIEASGPIRLVNMMQSLGGFMVLTWSATFLYSVCETAWSPRRGAAGAVEAAAFGAVARLTPPAARYAVSARWR